MGQEGSGGENDWNISRERVYVVFPFLQFFKEHSTKFPFKRQAQDGEETILDAMLLAISRFNCFKNYSHGELLDFYNRKGMPIINIWGDDLYNDLGILVKKPQTE